MLTRNFSLYPLSRLEKRQFNTALLFVTILVAGGILYFFDPSVPGGIYPSSPFRTLTGLYCPGCGTLRGLHQLLHGNLWTAFGLNPLMIASLPYLFYSYVCYSLPAFTGSYVKAIFIQPSWIWWTLRIILIYWVLRNIPFPPFSWLAP